LRWRQRKEGVFTPTEEDVLNESDMGRVGWLPDGRCLFTQKEESGERVMLRRMERIEESIKDIAGSIEELKEQAAKDRAATSAADA
jgi:hypothetical protein